MTPTGGRRVGDLTAHIVGSEAERCASIVMPAVDGVDGVVSDIAGDETSATAAAYAPDSTAVATVSRAAAYASDSAAVATVSRDRDAAYAASFTGEMTAIIQKRVDDMAKIRAFEEANGPSVFDYKSYLFETLISISF